MTWHSGSGFFKNTQRLNCRRLAYAIAWVILLSANAVLADESSVATQAASTPSALAVKPRWEFGLGGGHFSGFDYPASKDSNSVTLGLPFFIYRGELFRFAGRGVGAVALERPRVKLDFSLGGSLNAESSGNSVRAGLPDLDFLFEFGPALNILLSQRVPSSGGKTSLLWSNSLRGVLSTDFSSLDSRGVLARTDLQWRWRNVRGSSIDLMAELGLQWATEDLHDYFYQVDELYANAERSAFDAEGGFLGTELMIGAGVRINPSLRLFASVKAEDFSGAANQASPLFETTQSIGYAFALVWTAYRSQQTVGVFETE